LAIRFHFFESVFSMRYSWAGILTVVVMHATTGCSVLNSLAAATVHQRCGWKAEDYFTDPQVIALCRAIEASDLAEMERLVKAGADVNAQGKDKMTPLLWAFPDNQLPRFKWLLEHGANPNVVVEGEFNTRQSISSGDSVTFMSCKSSFPGYFDAVFDNGGDPNIRHSGPLGFEHTPLFAVITRGSGDKTAKIRRLIDLGADINDRAMGTTPVIQAVSWGGQFDLALVLLEAGANFRAYEEDEVQRLIHVVVRQEARLEGCSPEQRSTFQKLVSWLEERGQSYAQAKADLDRWDSWSRTTGEFRRKMDAEIAERKAREKAEAEKKPE
jgi:ankyrin repeat protein